MRGIDTQYSRRSALGLMASGSLAFLCPALAQERPLVTVSKDPHCGCCTGWVEHLRRAGFPAKTIDTADLQSIKARLKVPAELASCHTAEVAGYVLEGHVPASALARLLSEKPAAIGLAVPGMPIGSPGMEGGAPEVYEVILFGADGPRSFGHYRGDRLL